LKGLGISASTRIARLMRWLSIEPLSFGILGRKQTNKLD
jgi:hypothetical protein